MLKHVGKMKHNGAKVCVVYRTLPGDAKSALVVGSSTLSDEYHNTLMREVESPQGQQVNELGDHLSSRYFTDGTNMLEQLHNTGKLVRVPTANVAMTPDTAHEISLDELNLMIAEQKGVKLDDLAIKDDMPHRQKKSNSQSETQVQDVEIRDLNQLNNEAFNESVNTLVADNINPTAQELRSKADRLYKEAASLRKKADDIDPPKKKMNGPEAKKTTK